VAELIITVSPEGELVVRSEGLTRAQWSRRLPSCARFSASPRRQAVEPNNTSTISTFRRHGQARVRRLNATAKRGAAQRLLRGAPSRSSGPEHANLDRAPRLGSQSAGPGAPMVSYRTRIVWRGPSRATGAGRPAPTGVRLYAAAGATARVPTTTSVVSCADSDVPLPSTSFVPGRRTSHLSAQEREIQAQC